MDSFKQYHPASPGFQHIPDQHNWLEKAVPEFSDVFPIDLLF